MELKELLFKTLEKAEEALELPYEQRNDSESLNQAALELAKTIPTKELVPSKRLEIFIRIRDCAMKMYQDALKEEDYKNAVKLSFQICTCTNTIHYYESHMKAQRKRSQKADEGEENGE